MGTIRDFDPGFALDVLCLDVMGWRRSTKPGHGGWLYAPDGEPDVPLPDDRQGRTASDVAIPKPWRISRDERGAAKAREFLLDEGVTFRLHCSPEPDRYAIAHKMDTSVWFPMAESCTAPLALAQFLLVAYQEGLLEHP